MNLGFVRGRWRGDGLVEMSFGDRGHGFGIEVRTPEDGPHLAWSDGQNVELYIHTHVREDAIEHYGFATAAERSTFRLLITVSGVGPKLGLGILSKLGADGVLRAISGQDRALLQSVSGVGRKTAEQILLDLASKVKDVPPAKAGSSALAVQSARPLNERKILVTEALGGLGFRDLEIERMLGKIDPASWERDSAETIVRVALQAGG